MSDNAPTRFEYENGCGYDHPDSLRIEEHERKRCCGALQRGLAQYRSSQLVGGVEFDTDTQQFRVRLAWLGAIKSQLLPSACSLTAARS